MRAIKGGKIFTITNGVIEKGRSSSMTGKIAKVGARVKVPDGAEVIDATGKVVMPGLVEAHCHIGIWEEKIGWVGRQHRGGKGRGHPHTRRRPPGAPDEGGDGPHRRRDRV